MRERIGQVARLAVVLCTLSLAVGCSLVSNGQGPAPPAAQSLDQALLITNGAIDAAVLASTQLLVDKKISVETSQLAYKILVEGKRAVDAARSLARQKQDTQAWNQLDLATGKLVAAKAIAEGKAASP